MALDLWLSMPPATVLLLLLVHIAHQSKRIRDARQQLCTRRQLRNDGKRSKILLAPSFHAPLYTLSSALLLLRAALHVLIALDAFASDSALPLWRTAAFYWLLEIPSALFVALSSYLVLFYASVAHLRHWPTRMRWTQSYATAAYAIFCALLMVLVALFAWLRAALQQLESHRQSSPADRTDDHQDPVARAQALFSALVYAVLGLLLLQTSAKCTQLLWRMRRSHRLCVLDANALHALATASPLAAFLLLVRAGVTLCLDSPALKLPLASAHTALRLLLTQSTAWELAVVSAVVVMLRRVPIASDRHAGRLDRPSRVSLHVRVPTLRDLADDFVFSPRDAMTQRARLERYDRLFTDECSGVALGACDCSVRRDVCEHRLLSQALLAHEEDADPRASDLAQSNVIDDDEDEESDARHVALYFGE